MPITLRIVVMRMKAKIHTARFYFQRILPRTRGLVVSMLSGAANLMDLPDTDFWIER